MGAPKGEKIAIAMVVWLIRGGGRNILFDSGYQRDTFLKYFPSTEYIRPDEAVKLAGVQPEEITDIVVSHSHWDHLGGIDLFAKGTVCIQKEEFRFYTDEAWQPGGSHGGIDPEDVQQLVKLNTEGRLHLVDGDNVEIFPGIRAYTGGRHTYASQYLRVEGNPPFVLASDNCYLYRNLAEHKASDTFSKADYPANIKNQERMIQLAGYPERGDQVRGFSHDKTIHHFRLYADGGAIEAEATGSQDAASRDAIRSHFTHIAKMFAAGDFTAPMLIHVQNPPGTAEMSRLCDAI